MNKHVCMRTPLIISLLLSLALADNALPANSRGGLVVWWTAYPGARVGRGGSNGVVFWQGEVLTNIVAVAAEGLGALLLRNDGQVFGWRTAVNEPSCAPLAIHGQPLTNVVAVSADESGALAFRRDGTVAACDAWLRTAELIPGLTNVVAVTTVSNGRLLAVRRDGTVLCRLSPAEREAFGEDTNSPPAPPPSFEGHLLPPLPPAPPRRPTTVATIGGHPLTNVVALAQAMDLDWNCLALMRDGTVLALLLDPRDYGFTIFSEPEHPVAAHPLAVDGEVLTNVVAIAHRAGHCLALKSDGSALAWWGPTSHREALPPGLHGLAALALGGETTLALRRDGTVAMWGASTNVPVGLSHVVAIADGDTFCMAITTNTAAWPAHR